jgi:hypothetical protein
MNRGVSPVVGGGLGSNRSELQLRGEKLPRSDRDDEFGGHNVLGTSPPHASASMVTRRRGAPCHRR